MAVDLDGKLVTITGLGLETARFALRSRRPAGPVRFEILSDHVTHGVKDATASGCEKTASAKSNELLGAVQRFAETS